MQIYSSINNSLSVSQEDPVLRSNLLYEQLNEEYVKCGFTYKSNQILHKISERNPKDYPYLLLLHVSKVFHLNQFQIIFYSHILNEVSPCYEQEPDMFNHEDHEFGEQVTQIINQVFQQSINCSKQNHHNQLGQLLDTKKQYKHEEQQFDEEHLGDEMPQYTLPELKKIYLYLLVIGYAVKYYLNEQMKIKPYEDYLKRVLIQFFPKAFNKWAKKYGNSVLNTTPRKINSYYMGLGFLQGEQYNNEEKEGESCQYRNYNQIVEQLIKATSQGDQTLNIIAGQQEKEDFASNVNRVPNQNRSNNHQQHNSDNDAFDQ